MLAIDGAREIEANIFAAEVFRAIAQLPDAHREAALLVYCEGYSYAEAASALGIPIGTVMSRLAAARSAALAGFEWLTSAVEPLKFTNTAEQVDVMATVKGGGVGGQAGAVRMGLSRALSIFNPELRVPLRKNGFLTRDSRMKERKKYGQKGARKRFQFSKR